SARFDRWSHLPDHPMQSKRCAHCADGVILVCHRDTEQCQDLIAYELVDDTAVRLDDLHPADLMRPTMSATSSGSCFSFIAVYPDRSENRTVAWRRSPSASGALTAVRPRAIGLASASSPIDFSNFLRWPSKTPSFSRSGSVSKGKDSRSTPLSSKTCA